MIYFCLALLAFSIVAAPQVTFMHTAISDQYFDKIKLKKCRFLFRGINGKPIKKYGIIKSCLIFQIIGYVLGVGSFISSTIIVTVHPEYVKYTLYALVAVLVVFTISIGILYCTLKIKSDRLDKQDDE